ncbi:MAG: hypothetical protein WA364_07825 [Candidatus Nitrosopolaris sp.]
MDVVTLPPGAPGALDAISRNTMRIPNDATSQSSRTNNIYVTELGCTMAPN